MPTADTPTIRAIAVPWPRAPHQPGGWRAVIDEETTRYTPTLGVIHGGQRLWRCHHHHRTETTATTCATRAHARGAHQP